MKIRKISVPVPKLRWLLPIAVLMALFLTRGHSLLVNGAHNLTMVPRLPVLQDFDSFLLPECGQGVSGKVSPIGVVGSERTNLAQQLMAGWVSWLEGNCSRAERLWSQACEGYTMGEASLFCFYLFLNSEGEKGSMSRKNLDADTSAIYANLFGSQARNAQKISQAVFAYENSLEFAPSRDTANELIKLNRQGNLGINNTSVWEKLVIGLSEEESGHWYALGRIAELNEDWQKAISFYEIALETGGEECGLHMRIGSVYELFGKFDDAKDYYHESMRLCPNQISSYIALGDLSEERKDYAEALDWYNRANKIKPSSGIPEYRKGLLLYRKLDRVAEACDCFKVANNQNPSSVGIIYWLAQCEYDLGDLISAIAWMNTAVEMHSGEPWSWLLTLGDWYVESGREEEARQAYEQVLRWKPDLEKAQNRLGALDDE